MQSAGSAAYAFRCIRRPRHNLWDVSLSQPALSILAVTAAAVALLALVTAWIANRRLAATTRRYRVLWGDGTADVATLLTWQAQRMDGEATRVEDLERSLSTLRDEVSQTLQHIAVVRFDAFGDMGGRMSFSAAIVDDRGDGMVLTSIHARGESRTYAKGVVAGRSDITLTPEEQQALSAAREGE